MSRYSPSREQILREWSRHVRIRAAKRRQVVDIPDNSDPWCENGPVTITDLLRISDEVFRLETMVR